MIVWSSVRVEHLLRDIAPVLLRLVSGFTSGRVSFTSSGGRDITRPSSHCAVSLRACELRAPNCS